MKKRILSLILALAMSASLAAPTTALAAEPMEASSATVYEQDIEKNDTQQEETESTEPTPPEEKAVPELTGIADAYTFSAAVQDAALNAVSTGDGSITYVSDNSNVVAVDETTGALTFVAVGTATITVKAAETEQYQAVEKQVLVTVTKAEQEITGVKSTLQLKYKSKGTYQLQAKTNGDGALTYKSSDTSVTTVSKAGKITMKKLGTVTITITAKKTARYESATTKVKVTIYKTAAKLKVSKYYKKSKFYKNLMALKLSDTNRKNLMAIAETQVGYHEGNKTSQLGGTNQKGTGNYTEYGYVYGLQGAWCAMFVNWCARENATSTKVIPKYCRVMDYRNFYQKKNRYYTWAKTKGGKGKYLPKAGDLIFYTTYPGASSQHIGYVKSCKIKGKKITVVTTEGNSSDQCRHKTYTLSTKSNGRIAAGWYIHGFASPNY